MTKPSNTLPRIALLATGGTIAGRAGGPMRHDYTPGEIGIADLLEKVDELGIPARIEGEQIANIGSEDISCELWSTLHARCGEAIDDPDCDAIVITHGTDTAEETAFLLDLTLPTTKPVVLVGAMRPADAVGYDGLRNLANALRIARAPDAAGRGVLVIMGDRVFAARDIRKARTRGLDAFAGFPRESVALVTPSKLEWFGAPWREGEGARLPFPAKWPDVPVIFVHAAMSAKDALRVVREETRGIVVAGLGEGNMPEGVRTALRECAARGIAVVRSSRLDEGLVDREPEDERNGFVAARALGPAKARVLLLCLLAQGITSPGEIQRWFDGR